MTVTGGWHDRQRTVTIDCQSNRGDNMMVGTRVCPQFGWGWNQHEQINEILYKALPQDSLLRDFLHKHHKAIAKACEEEDKIGFNSKRSHVVHLDDIEQNSPPCDLIKTPLLWKGLASNLAPNSSK